LETWLGEGPLALTSLLSHQVGDGKTSLDFHTAVDVRLHRGGPQGAKPNGKVVADIFGGHQGAKGVKLTPESSNVIY
jgi:hypothetical protein